MILHRAVNITLVVFRASSYVRSEFAHLLRKFVSNDSVSFPWLIKRSEQEKITRRYLNAVFRIAFLGNRILPSCRCIGISIAPPRTALQGVAAEPGEMLISEEMFVKSVYEIS